MKLSIINAFSSKNQNKEIDKIRQFYKTKYSIEEISIINVDTSLLKDCIGCWDCWVKTPGVCIHKDIMKEIYSAFINSDIALYMLDTACGFISGSSKTLIDRLIALYHPYIRLVKGEMTHFPRYEKYPKISFFYDDSNLSNEEKEALKNYLGRTIYQFSTTGSKLDIQEEVIEHELSHNNLKEEISKETLKNDFKGKVIIYNGSPRGKNGNSLIIANEIKKGMLKKGLSENDIEIRNLYETKNHELWANDISNHSRHLFIFPLYVHAMPGIVMKFLEKISNQNKTISFSFLVQSGFMESAHSHYIRPYLGLYCKRIGVSYGGTAIKGGMEGIKMRPENSLKNLFSQFQNLGSSYIAEGAISDEIIKSLANPVDLSNVFKFIFYIGVLTGTSQFYWNMQLKKNGAFDKRWDRPYLYSNE